MDILEELLNGLEDVQPDEEPSGGCPDCDADIIRPSVRGPWWKEYVLFKFRIMYAENYKGKDRPEFEIGVFRVEHNTHDKRGEFLELDVEEAVSPNADVPSYWPRDPVSGFFGSLEEAEIKLTAAGWNLEDATSRFNAPDNGWLGRSLVKAYKLTKISEDTLPEAA